MKVKQAKKKQNRDKKLSKTAIIELSVIMNDDFVIMNDVFCRIVLSLHRTAMNHNTRTYIINQKQ